MSIIHDRRSVRAYDPEYKLTPEQIDSLLEAAMAAPSACNSRPWEFIVITRPETLKEIARLHPHAKMCATAAAVIVVVGLPQTGNPEGYYPQDCAAATQNILLGAAELGLGTCWCGVYPKEARMETLYELLSIDRAKIPFNVIAIGLPAESPAKRGFFDRAKVTYID